MPSLNPGVSGFTPPKSPAQDDFLPFANLGKLGYSGEWLVRNGFGEIEATNPAAVLSNYGGSYRIRASTSLFLDGGSSGGFLRDSGFVPVLSWTSSLIKPFQQILFDNSIGYTYIGFTPQVAPNGAPFFGIPNGIQFLAQHAGVGSGVAGADAGIQGGDGDGAGFGGPAWIRAGGGGTPGIASMKNAAGTDLIQVGGAADGVGFNGTAPIAKPAISGSRGGNAALASLITAGAALGLWTDSTTA